MLLQILIKDEVVEATNAKYNRLRNASFQYLKEQTVSLQKMKRNVRDLVCLSSSDLLLLQLETFQLN
jgi:hypothetical protein